MAHTNLITTGTRTKVSAGSGMILRELLKTDLKKFYPFPFP
jgi:hypothetical protein